MDEPELNNEGLLEHDGAEDEAAARYIERVRLGLPVDPARTIREVCACAAARRIQQLGSEDSDPEDLAYVTRIDVFDFAMEVSPTPRGMRLLSRPA